MRMLLQRLPQSFAQDAHAAAMDDAHAWQASEKCTIDKLLHFASGIVHVVADYVDFRGCILPFIFERYRNPRARAAFSGESAERPAEITAAISSRAIFIFIAPMATSKWESSSLRKTVAARPVDFNFTLSPWETYFTTWGAASGSF